jgi:hypothetical protein
MVSALGTTQTEDSLTAGGRDLFDGFCNEFKNSSRGSLTIFCVSARYTE